jgi:ABC-type glycerol-3-phosphate transport system substrate-binding protein
MMNTSRSKSRLASITALGILVWTAPATAEDFSGTTLNALVLSQPSQLDCLQKVATDFEASTGAKVQLVGQGYANLRDSALTAFVGGTGAYDVVSVAYQWTGEFAGPGYLAPLDDIADAPGMIDRAKELYGNGQFGTAIMGLREQALTMWSNRYWGLGGGSLDPDKTGKVSIDPAIAKAALEQLARDVKEFSPPGALAYGLPEASAQFLSGNVAMVEMWPSVLGPMTLDPEGAKAVLGKVAVALVPGGYPHSGGWGLAVPASSGTQAAAKAFIKLATSVETDGRCLTETGKGPVYASTYQTAKAYWLPAQADAIANAQPRSRGEEAGRINDMFDEVVARFLSGELTSDAAVAEMQSRLAQ